LKIFDEISEVKLKDTKHRMVLKGWGEAVADGIELNRIVYNSEGIPVKGYIAKPVNITGKLPLIIWNRGGDEKNGLLDDFLAFGILGEIASWGYIVAASMYRDADEFGGADVNDVINLMNLASGIKDSDGINIGMEGWSRGGMMTYLALTKTDKVKCAITVAGLANLKRNFLINNYLDKKFEELFPEKSGFDREKEIRKRSAVDIFRDINTSTSLLMMHGTADDKVSFEDSLELYEQLNSVSASAKYEIEIIEDGDHYLSRHKQFVSEKRRKWYGKYLKI
jgi:dipeptidyl aminopeptidase/acylaminoacyl peptidase